MVGQQANRKCFGWVSVLVACFTLIMLTSTVTHAASAVTQYSGTHVVYVRCDAPTAQEEAVWLAIRERYRAVDFSVLTSERARWLARYEPDLAAEVEYRAADAPGAGYEEYERYEAYMLYQVYEDHQEHQELEQAGAHDNRLSQLPGKAIRRAHQTPELPGNEVPLTHSLDPQASDSSQYLRFEVRAVEPVTWRGKDPTPPPRYI